jgi:hypothetical protein
MKKEITAEERADLIHEWKVCVTAGDDDRAEEISKLLKNNPAPLSPEVQAIAERLKVLPSVETIVTMPEEVGVVKTKKKGTGKRGRPKGSKNKSKKSW